MKLVIEVKVEDYKRYKEDKICSYTSAVLDAVPLNEVLDKIRDEIERKAHSGQWSDATMYGMLKAVAIIDKYRKEQE